MTVRAPALARVFSVLFVTLLLASPAATPSRAAESEKFGTVDFATSCSAAAQTPFKVGVALLHSFAFDAAIKWFTEAAQIDPGCAIAHWGVAVAWLGNPLAAPPSARARSSALTVLATRGESKTIAMRESACTAPATASIRSPNRSTSPFASPAANSAWA